MPAIARQRRVPGTSRRADCNADESTFCEYNYGIPCIQPDGLLADPAEIKSLTDSPLMKTLASLINQCPRHLWVLFCGINQRLSLVQRAQAATFLVARTGWTPAHFIHAPMPRPPR